MRDYITRRLSLRGTAQSIHFTKVVYLKDLFCQAINSKQNYLFWFHDMTRNLFPKKICLPRHPLFSDHTRMVWARSEPTETKSTGVSTISVMRLMYDLAFTGRSLYERMPVVGVTQPGWVSYTGSTSSRTPASTGK